jgi:putative restriction endonuclease
MDFSGITIGKRYTRPALAAMWAYRSYNAISKGVVTPRDKKDIVLFVTRIKQESLTQYQDYIEGDILHWEGERRHGSDLRIARAAENGDTIHLFYRDIHHSPFEYKGIVQLERFEPRQHEPSKFTFRLLHDQSPADDIELHSPEFEELEPTEKEAIVRSRVGQGRFRAALFDLWGGCAITGVTNDLILRASHIKPWRVSTNRERLSPYNGLLLLPHFDHLFDRGFIGFEPHGEMRVSPVLTRDDCEALHLEEGIALRRVPSQTEEFLQYHRSQVFVGQDATD